MDSTDLNHNDCWHFTHLGFAVEIRRWGLDNPHLCDGKGCWNYYVYLHEKTTPDFDKLWLEAYHLPSFPNILHHDYEKLSICQDINWHGEVTWYEKLGHDKGHRTVKLGCDYQHFLDSENGYNTTIEQVVSDAKVTCGELYLLFHPEVQHA